ncbi:HD domain-containing protein [Thermofilum sp.]|jgi:HD superfamily phosphodiesterase|uniref:phosphatase domain-containing putative toxin n=1 Tax=Thermofilum sp. TaxID=1961369 RepID=UPI0025901150|nr:HD domain-containing protein [Thermofilum sp.]
MARLRDLNGGLYWSSCPDTETLRQLAKRGLGLVVDLTENECRYELPSTVKKISYPIPDFSFRAFEGVLYKAVLPALEALRSGKGVLIHCYGGIGRSGSTVGMLLALRDNASPDTILGRLRSLGYVNETISQGLALRWFFRAIKIADLPFLKRLLEEVENTGYWGYLDHASTVAGVALDVLDALQDKYRFTAQDRLNTYVAGLLHDIGRVWGREEDHHIIGAEYVKKADFLGDKVDLDIVSKTILYHRRKTRITEDQELASMGVKALVIAATVRLADSFKNAYKGEGIYVGTEMANDKLVVKINGYMHEEVDFDRFYEKAEALEEVTKIRVEAVEEF